MRNSLLVVVSLVASVLLGCRPPTEDQGDTKEDRIKILVSEMGEDDIALLATLVKDEVKKRPEEYQAFLEEMSSLILTHHENGDELVRGMVKKQIAEDPMDHFSFIKELIDEEIKVYPMFAIQLEMYASKAVREETQRLLK